MITCTKCDKFCVGETEEHLDQESMNTNFLSLNLRIPESPQPPNISPERDKQVEGLNSGGCGILGQSIP